MRDQPVEWPAVEGDAAGLVLQRAAQAVDQRALARAVRPDQPDPLAGGDRQVDAVERDKAAEALAEPADGKERRRTHAALCGSRCGAPTGKARRRRRACTRPTMPFGAIITKPISNNPTISRLSAEEIVTVASCWIVPSSTAPMIGPTQLVIPPITGIATLLTA